MNTLPVNTAPIKKDRPPANHGKRIIMCVDMDAFFASVEQKANPHLRGKPIAVVGSNHRTVITTSSYEARAWGVKTGMNPYEARQICPRLIFVPGNNARYTHTCTEMAKIFRRYTPEVEVYSVDEAFLDVTDSHHLFGGPMAIGWDIKKRIRDTFGINCTVGIGPNILTAKLASDMGKPDGLNWLRPENLRGALENLEVDELWGIGRKTAGKLGELGIRTCGELGRAPASLLRSKFGIHGETLVEMGRGVCRRSVRTEEEEDAVKSVGNSMTLTMDIWDRRDFEAYLLQLSEKVGRRARKHSLMGKRITLTVRYSDFETFTKQATLSGYTNDTHVIYQSVLRILDSFRLKTKVRLLGVSLGSLLEDPGQLPLMEEERKRRFVLEAMDSVNDRYGEGKLTWAKFAFHRTHGDVISPAWRPSGVKNMQLR